MAMQAATLEILEKADLPPRQARAIAQAIELEVSAGHSALATRADFLALRQSMDTQFVSLRQDLESKIAGSKQELETKITGSKQDLETKISGSKQGLEAMIGGVKQDALGLKQELSTMIIGSRHELELKMAEHKSELVRWVFLCILGQSAMLLGVSYFLFGHIST